MNYQDILDARERISEYTLVTPLLRMPSLDEALGCQVYVKLENMQRTGAFKFRGAMNKILQLSPEAIEKGFVAASSGNHGKAVAYAAKMLNTKATIVMPDSAPAIKVQAIRDLGAEVVLCEVTQRFAIAADICAKTGGTMIPPYDDEAIMAGQGTAGLEIMEQCPEADIVITPISGGGLLGGVATAIKGKAKAENMKAPRVYGAEPALTPRYSKSLAAGERVTVPAAHSIADALPAITPGMNNFPCVQANADGVVPVEEGSILKAMKLLLTEGKILAEPSSCIGMAAILEGKIEANKEEKVCFLISGGSVGLSQLDALKDID